MKNVLHISSVHKAFDTRIFFKECKSLAEAGYDVSLMVSHDKEETVDGIKIIPFHNYKSRVKRILLSPFKMFFMARKQKADIYHFHDPELLVTGLLLRIFTKSKVIYDIHDNYTYSILIKPYLKFHVVQLAVSKVFYIIEKFISLFMTANIVTVPHWAKKYPRAVLVRNYPVLGNSDERKDENRFIYIGTLGSKRCTLEMVLIFVELEKMIPGVKFDIIGNFTEKGLEEKVMENIKRCPAITYMGYRPYSEAQKALPKAKYGFVLYIDIDLRDSISVKVLEYLAYDIVPIFSIGDTFKHEIKGEGCGIGVDPKNPVDSARKIYEIITNEEKKRAVEENTKCLKLDYNWESEKKELLNLYKGI